MDAEETIDGERLRKLIEYAATLAKTGLSRDTIQRQLLEFGISPSIAEQIVEGVRVAPQMSQLKAGDRLKKIRTQSTKESGAFLMLIGGAMCAVGIIVTALSYQGASETGGFFVINYGLIFAGAVQFVLGLSRVLSGKD